MVVWHRFRFLKAVCLSCFRQQGSTDMTIPMLVLVALHKQSLWNSNSWCHPGHFSSVVRSQVFDVRSPWLTLIALSTSIYFRLSTYGAEMWQQKPEQISARLMFARVNTNFLIILFLPHSLSNFVIFAVSESYCVKTWWSPALPWGWACRNVIVRCFGSWTALVQLLHQSIDIVILT